MPPSDPEALWTRVDRYLNDTLHPSDPALEAALAANAAANLPSIDVAPNQGKFLTLLAETQSARRILEIGTLGGYSTICLARALPPGGKLITLELDPHHAEVALANIAHAGLAHLVELRLGPALASLTQLHAEHAAPFDLIFLDADKVSYPLYLAAALKLSRPGTLILADNVIREGEVADPTSTDPNVVGVRQFLADLAANPNLSATALQTVGSKGHDGFAMARVLTA
ncbi:MAG: O-methyltransferase [Acidobacteriaceae bacterium]